MNLAEFLKEKTPSRGDQSDLCRKLGVSNGTVSRWIAGDADRITFESCLRIAKAFNEDPELIFRMSSRTEYLNLYRSFFPKYQPKELTSTDLYPADHAPYHDLLESLLESGSDTEIEWVSAALTLAEEKARRLHGPHHPRAKPASRRVNS